MKSRSKSSLLVALLSSLILVLFNFGALAAGKVQSATSQAVIKYKAPEDAKPEKPGGRITVPATAKGIVKYKKGCGENMRLYRGNCICLGGLKLVNGICTKIEIPKPAPTIAITPSELPFGTVGSPYSDTLLAANGGTQPYRFSVSSGSLPPGLRLSNSGQISGVPTKKGAYRFEVEATDRESFSGTRFYSVSIRPKPCLPPNK